MEKHGQRKVNTKLIIGELHKAFSYLNRDLFEGKLPEPAILIQSRGNKKLCLGWCTVGKVWINSTTQEERYEINLVAEAVNRGLFPVMTTLIHEMVHLYHLENDIKGVTRGNTYHNKRFKEDCERIGMIVEHDDKIGWSHCTLTPFLMEKINSYGINEEAFTFGRKNLDEGEKKKKKKKSSSRKYICPECGTSVRASKDVLILCGLCSDIEEGRAVVMEKELTEDDIPPADTTMKYCTGCGEVSEVPKDECCCPLCGEEYLNGDSEEKEDETIEPIVEIPVEIETRNIENAIELVCQECGCLTTAEKSDYTTYVCGECGSSCVTILGTAENESEEVEELPVGLTEVETQLDDGFGNMIDVKQVTMDAPEVEGWSTTKNTGWDIERVREVMRESAKAIGEEAPFDYEAVEVVIKKMKPYGKCYEEIVKTRGRGANKLVVTKIQLSEEHLRIHSDADIVDTIKHEFVHAWVDTMKNKDQKHNDIWKRYCVKVGCEPSATADIKAIAE